MRCLKINPWTYWPANDERFTHQIFINNPLHYAKSQACHGSSGAILIWMLYSRISHPWTPESPGWPVLWWDSVLRAVRTRSGASHLEFRCGLMYEHREGWGHGVGRKAWEWGTRLTTPALCWQVEHLKEKLISQAQEVSRLRSELVSPTTPSYQGWGVGRSFQGTYHHEVAWPIMGGRLILVCWCKAGVWSLCI